MYDVNTYYCNSFIILFCYQLSSTITTIIIIIIVIYVSNSLKNNLCTIKGSTKNTHDDDLNIIVEFIEKNYNITMTA